VPCRASLVDTSSMPLVAAPTGLTSRQTKRIRAQAGPRTAWREVRIA